MTGKYKTGDTAYIVANRIFVKEVTIIKYSGGLYTLRLSDTGGGLKLRENRLFPTKEAAEQSIKR